MVVILKPDEVQGSNSVLPEATMVVSLFYAYYAYKWLWNKCSGVLLPHGSGLPEVKNTLTAAGVLDPTLQKEMVLKMVESVECPICLEIAIPPLIQCSKGHFACSVCRPKLDKCGLCRSKFTKARNFAIENIVATMVAKCGYSGCPQVLKISQVREHKEKCGYRPLICSQCPSGRRDKYLIEWGNYTKHLKEVHKCHSMNFVPGQFCKIRYNLAGLPTATDKNTKSLRWWWRSFILVLRSDPEATFFVNFEVEDSTAFIWITALCPDDVERYMADLRISKMPSRDTTEVLLSFKYMVTITVAPLHTTRDLVKYSRYCAAIPLRSLRVLSTFNSDGNLYFSLQVGLRTHTE